MKRLISLLLALALTLSCTACSRLRGKHSSTFYLFDTYCTLTCYDVTKAESEWAAKQLEKCLTVFHEETDIFSEQSVPNLAALNRSAGKEAVSLSGQLLDFLQYAKDAYAASNGRVNVMLGPVTALWHQTRETGVLPTAEKLAEANALCQTDYLVLTGNTAYITKEGASIDVGALAKGYAGRLARDVLSEIGITDYLLNLGGTIVAGGTPKGTGRSKFTIGIQDPGNPDSLVSTLSLASGECVATSGDYQRYVEIDGVRYHHLIDPDTLFPSAYQHSVTVVCDDPALADLLSTALFMMTREDGEALAKTLGVKVYYN